MGSLSSHLLPADQLKGSAAGCWCGDDVFRAKASKGHDSLLRVSSEISLLQFQAWVLYSFSVFIYLFIFKRIGAGLMTGQRGHLLPHPPLTGSNSLSFYLLSAFCGLQEGVLTQQVSRLEKKKPPTVTGGFWFNIILPPKVLPLLHVAVRHLEGCCVSHLLHPSLLQTRLMFHGGSAALVIADLCVDTSFGINQAYQRDSCLFTCYKHLPAPRLCSISTQIIYRCPASTLCPCLLSCCGSNINSLLPCLF